ncbi:sugar transferase [Pseudogemmobacter faecipullorum]|uniref:Sugar transferase n=1 Tax=Pseudogemmobacter faecipullorum TaxID=2755041 RepID=A0ABS8CHA9_9RHOB|nr:sugar transferase [Pseudogemmobacter faecipullorum]MCB5408744.1 sugar transferase [Pseudogemmobacter faecipullorum]
MTAPGLHPAQSNDGSARMLLALKRVSDLVLVALALPIVAPAFLVIALLVRLSGPGPVLLRLSCVGQNGRVFGKYRFRIVYMDAERRLRAAERDPQGDSGRDPRVTPIGAWLARNGLNRLPQLLNVLRGDMSVVGPRPITLACQRDSYPFQEHLLQVRPGIFTPESLVDEQFARSETDRRALDLAYAANPALSTDTRILVTAFARMIGLRSV